MSSGIGEYTPGERVRYDDDGGVVLERVVSGRIGSDDYRVRFDYGGVRRVWGSDLVPEVAE